MTLETRFKQNGWQVLPIRVRKREAFKGELRKRNKRAFIAEKKKKNEGIFQIATSCLSFQCLKKKSTKTPLQITEGKEKPKYQFFFLSYTRSKH